MSVGVPDLTEKQRVELIVKAFVFCGQELDETAIADQFRRETGKVPDKAGMKAAIEAWKGREK